MNSRVAKAIVKVGDGRGFIIQHRVELPRFKGRRYFRDHRLIVTAAHCLPYLPPCCGASYGHERTYMDLVGPLDGGKGKIWAECLFVDPVADIALLGGPDGEELFDQARAYEELTDGGSALQMGKAPRRCQGYLLSLDGKWIRCIVKHHGGPLWIEALSGPIEGGMSGSPILIDNATAIGVVCLGGGEPEGPNPRLEHNLPGWLLQTARIRK